MNLDQLLRDAATPAPRRVHEAPAQAMLDGIVRTAATPAAPTPARPVRQPRRRFAVAGLAALVAAGAALTPALLPDRAYASWTPAPSPLPAADARRIVTECAPDLAAGAPRVAVGEKRGEYAYLTVVTATWSKTCFQDKEGRVTNPSMMADPVATAALGRRGVELHAWGQFRTEEGYGRLMAGHLGTDITAVTIAVPEGDRTVQATVADGYFAAWYPESADAPGGTTLTLTLRDGTTVPGISARDLMEAPQLD